MAGRSRRPIRADFLQVDGSFHLTITWEVSSRLSVELATQMCQADAAKALPELRGKRPIQTTAAPLASYESSTLTTREELS